MNWFNLYVEYIRRDIDDSNLQQYILIWDDRYPSMIRRSLAMSLKEKLDSLPKKNEKDDLRGLKDVLEKLAPTLYNIEAKTDNIHRIFNKVDDKPKPKKLSLKQQRDKAFKEAVEREELDLIRQINQM